MAVTLKGKGVRWGVGMTGTIITTSLAQSGDMTYSSNTAELLDKDGIRVGVAFIDTEKTISITVVPSGATAAAAATQVDEIVLAPGTAVTITDAHVAAAADVDVAGAYVAEGSRIRETNSGAMLLEIDLYQTSEIASYAAIT